MKNVLVYFAIKYKGDFHDIFNALKNHEKIEQEDLLDIENKILNSEIQAITILEKEYPSDLKQLLYPPFVIFYKGNKEILSNKNRLALTGNKSILETDKYLNQSLPEIIKRHTLVTNFVKGLDQEIEKYFYENKGKTIYVSTNGVETSHFASKAKLNENTLIISEYPNGTRVSEDRLKKRNRIVAALANNLVIYQSNKESDIMNLVSNFLELGKDVYCYPGEADKEDGNTILIKQGANLITKIKDVYDDSLN